MRRLRNGSTFLLVLMALLGRPSSAAAQWTGLTNGFPSGFAEHCLQLTDGTVMCHEYNTNRWHRLKPDINGSYQNGSWDVPGFTVANMPDANDATWGCVNCTYQPLFFASQVLADGRVVIIGGEYNNLTTHWSNIGFLYDPATDTWSGQLTVPAGWCCSNGAGSGGIGDAQSTVLPNGTMLLATTNGTDMASFDPATLTFTALGPTGKDDSNDQENWNILPDGKVLTVDSRTAQRSEVYNPATNAWEAAVDTQVNLADVGAGTKNSSEVGPAVLRPDGTLIAFSGTNSGLNAVYDTNTGTWTATGASANFPAVGAGHYAVADGPATLLPNGTVLVMGSPVTATNVFQTPSHFWVFDGTNLTQVADAANAASFISYQGRFLLLPTGEVLLTAYNQCPPCGGTPAVATVQLYTAGGSPQNAWRPVITVAPANVSGGNTYPISGMLFNGFSEGASYGDDAQMSTNYPLVRIKNIGTGHVFYTRTHGHSRMGVEPVGSNEIITTQFDTPAGLEAGPSELVVVANGIPSEPIVVNGVDLTIAKTHSPAIFGQGDTGDTFTITVGNQGNASTSATVTVVDTLPASLTATAMTGSGWSCNVGTLTCTTNVVLGPGGTYPDITLTVDVASNAPILVTNSATVSGGGQANTVNVTGNDTDTDDVNVRQHTTTTYTGPTVIPNGLPVTLSAVLLANGVDPLAGRTLVFTLGTGGSAQTCNGLTDLTGTASCVISPVNQPLGPGVVSVEFAGELLYFPSSDTDATTIFAFLTSGAFTVGDVSALGNPVTFWGAQWANQNVLSGGAAPNAFKGFANETAEPPTCLGGWATQPGNSSSPPATVPSFMGVIVPRTVTKSGSTISGDILKIVVVQTNPGYAPNPGHAGTGVVVATYCVKP